MDQVELFENNDKLLNSVKIVRLTDNEARVQNDHLCNFRNLVMKSEEMYPKIDRWLTTKVIPGLLSKERVAYVGYLDEEPAISAVVKKGAVSKFCHLKINPNLQSNRLGEVFFSLMALDVRDFAKDIYFTLPEGLWESKKEFFSSFGFNQAKTSQDQYRTFEEELRCDAPFQHVWKNVRIKLPKIISSFQTNGYSTTSDIILSVKAEIAEKIMSGKKRVEIRTRFNKNLIGAKVAIYASSPKKSIVGQVKIIDVIEGNPKIIWDKYENYLGVSKKIFDKYVGNRSKVYAILLDDVQPFLGEVPLTQLEYLTNKQISPPQSYSTVAGNEKWSEILTVASLLQSSFKYRSIVV